MNGVAALQPLLIGVVLVWSAYGKLFGRLAGEVARRSALKRIVGERRVLPAYRAVGVVELAIGAALLLPVRPGPGVAAGAATALSAGFVGYLGWARVVAPDSTCGCSGSAQLPITWRSLSRAGLLLAASVLALTASAGWWTAVSAGPVLVVLAEALLFVGLSGELDRHWLLPLRRLRVRLTHPLAGTASADLPLASSQQQLLRSPAYASVAGLLRSDIREHWDDGEWRFLTYTSSYDGALAVFAVPRLRYDPDAVRVALVDESTGRTLTPA